MFSEPGKSHAEFLTAPRIISSLISCSLSLQSRLPFPAVFYCQALPAVCHQLLQSSSLMSLRSPLLSLYVVGARLLCTTGKMQPPQHEQGDDFYVVEEGTLQCFVTFPGEKEEVEVRTPYRKGESFGELALMYNNPRAAT